MTTTTFVMICILSGLLIFLAPLADGASPAPSSKPASQPKLGAPAEAEFTSTLDNTTQKYMILLPPAFDAAAPHDLMIAFHGHGSDRRQYAADPRSECAAARDVAAKHNMIFISPDYRAATSWMGPAAEADVVQLIGELKKKHKVGKVFITGASMGGTAVLTFAALHKDLVDGVCSLNGTANLLEYDVTASGIAEAIKMSFGGNKHESVADFKKRGEAEYKKRSAEFHPEQFTMPLAIVVSGNDHLVPPASTVRLAKAVQKTNRKVMLLERPTAGHQTSYADGVAAMDFVIDAANKK